MSLLKRYSPGLIDTLVHRSVSFQRFTIASFADILSRVMPHKKSLTIRSLSIPVQIIERRIYLTRGQKVMIDEDLAELYGVPTKRLNQQVTRNRKRFPKDFMFQLTKAEAENLRLQFAT